MSRDVFRWFPDFDVRRTYRPPIVGLRVREVVRIVVLGTERTGL
jgi:hypothetical protein